MIPCRYQLNYLDSCLVESGIPSTVLQNYNGSEQKGKDKPCDEIFHKIIDCHILKENYSFDFEEC